MNRQEYLTYRNNNNIGNIVFNYYIKRREQDQLDVDSFMRGFNIWGGAAFAVKTVLFHYDVKFEVLEISKQGQIIKYI